MFTVGRLSRNLRKTGPPGVVGFLRNLRDNRTTLSLSAQYGSPCAAAAHQPAPHTVLGQQPVAAEPGEDVPPVGLKVTACPTVRTEAVPGHPGRCRTRRR